MRKSMPKNAKIEIPYISIKKYGKINIFANLVDGKLGLPRPSPCPLVKCFGGGPRLAQGVIPKHATQSEIVSAGIISRKTVARQGACPAQTFVSPF